MALAVVLAADNSETVVGTVAAVIVTTVSATHTATFDVAHDEGIAVKLAATLAESIRRDTCRETFGGNVRDGCCGSHGETCRETCHVRAVL